MFPYWIKSADDGLELERLAGVELDAWRRVREAHRGAKDLGVRLALRPRLEAAYNQLRDAYRAGLQWADEQAAKAA